MGDILDPHRHVELPASANDLLERRTRERARLREENHLLSEKHQGRDRTDVERGGQLLFVVAVHFREYNVGVLFRSGLEYRRETLARPAPGPPEIDEDHVVILHDLLEIVLAHRDRSHPGTSGFVQAPNMITGPLGPPS